MHRSRSIQLITALHLRQTDTLDMSHLCCSPTHSLTQQHSTDLHQLILINSWAAKSANYSHHLCTGRRNTLQEGFRPALSAPSQFLWVDHSVQWGAHWIINAPFVYLKYLEYPNLLHGCLVQQEYLNTHCVSWNFKSKFDLLERMSLLQVHILTFTMFLSIIVVLATLHFDPTTGRTHPLISSMSIIGLNLLS